MAEELAGQLAERVDVEQWQPARDALAADAGAWVAIGSGFAGVVPDGAAVAVAGEARRSGRRWRVLMRAQAELSGAAGLLVRLRWRGQWLHVLGVEEDPRMPDRVVLRCEGRGP
ncbi:MAG: head-tail adaptor protein [Alphaproteobacteria bacterium]|nr:head-tail adaptor protein [Alphaproteobacteria bacterium]